MIERFALHSESVYGRLAKGTFWSLTGVALGKALVLVASILCARILGDVQFGKFGIIRSTISMFVVFGSAGLGTTASKFIAEYRATGNSTGITKVYYLTNVFALTLAIILSFIIIAFSLPLSTRAFNDPSLSTDIRIGSVLLLFSIINSAQNGVLSGFERFRTIALNTLLASVLECLGIIIGSYLGGVDGAILGYGISYLFWSLLNFLSIKKAFNDFQISRRYLSLNRDDISLLWRFSLPSALNSIMVAPSFWIVKSMLVKHDGFAQLGIYEAADQWKIIILFAPNAIANILMPIFSNVNGKNETSSYKRVLNLSVFLNGAIALVLVVFIFLFKGTIMGLYGKGFEEPNVLFVLCASTVFSAMAQVLTLSFISRAKAWTSFVFNFIWAILLISLSFYFLSLGFGALALAVANLLSYIIHFVFQFLYYKIWDR